MEPIPQAGALCFKRNNGALLVLLVRAKRNPANWIFPKGHIEPGESTADAALRELKEEAGVTGTIGPKLGDREYERDGRRYRVSYYLVEWTADIDDGEQGRTPSWYTVEDAAMHLSFADGRELLAAAQKHFR